ncbi:Ribosomal RNA large subunit methyltransferase E [subsurface metagenome]
MKKIQNHYFKKAKKEKYSARSVYKLEEINNKYQLIKNGFQVLDIGCAPGSWSQYLLKKIGNGKIVGIDIKKNVQISDKRFTFIHGNIFHIDEKFLNSNRNTFNLITSDAAPNTTGNKFVDSQNSLAIVKKVFRIAQSVLKINGSIIAKVFQGEDLKAFIDGVRIDFLKIVLFKPKSSRKESNELFIIAIKRNITIDTKY